jgi:hypothetical protein
MEQEMKNVAPNPVDIRARRLQCLSMFRRPVIELRSTAVPGLRKATGADDGFRDAVVFDGLPGGAGRQMWVAGVGHATFAGSCAGR